MPRKVLLVEDNLTVAKSVELALRPEGFTVTVAPDVASARPLAAAEFDVILLDLMLPDGSGLDLCAEIRLKQPDVPILMITAKLDEDSAVQGLAQGADDYIRKPFGKRELLARIRKCLGEKVPAAKTLRFEDLELNLGTREASVSGKAVDLRPKEFLVLSVLVQKGGELASREDMLRLIDTEGELYDRTLDSHVSRIRSALRKAGVKHLELATVHGAGYRLKKVA